MVESTKGRSTNSTNPNSGNEKGKCRKRIPRYYTVKDLVAVKPETTRYNDGPQTVKEVYANGTVKLRQITPKGGAATQIWNKGK